MNLTEFYQIYGGNRYFSNIAKDYYIIFIHDLKEWTTKQLYNVIYLNTINQFNFFFSVGKKYSPKYGSYFAIKVNAPDQHTLINFLLSSIKRLPVTSKIGWKHYNINSPINNNSLIQNRKNYKENFKQFDSSFYSMHQDFFSSHLSNNSTFFNLCASWNINGWNNEKKDSVLYLNSIFKPVCICLQETLNSKFLVNDRSSSSPFLPNYIPVFLKANKKVPGMRGLYLGVHSSCSFCPEPLVYDFIISVCINSFWDRKCSVGNMYFPQSSLKNARLKVFFRT